MYLILTFPTTPYPPVDKYRVLVWQSLLQLPGNTAAYQALASRGIHPAYENLGQSYPLKVNLRVGGGMEVQLVD